MQHYFGSEDTMFEIRFTRLVLVQRKGIF